MVNVFMTVITTAKVKHVLVTRKQYRIFNKNNESQS